MHLFRYLVPSLLLLSSSITLHADNATAGEAAENLESLTEYLKNLGSDFGFDVTQAVDSPLATLLDLSATTLSQQYAFISLLGAIPVNAFKADNADKDSVLAYFVPESDKDNAPINDMANYTFASATYSNPSVGEKGGVSVSALIDQPTYQNDPVSQSILNAISTPSTTYCLNNDANGLLSDSDCNKGTNGNMTNGNVMINVVGDIPGPSNFFSFTYNKNIMTQLNSNTLLSPLLYTTDGSDPGNNTDKENPGLIATNQVQDAVNFIRYATRSVTPPELPLQKDYKTVFDKASDDTGDVSDFDKYLAQVGISKYITKLRTYSAQQSVAISNLYAMLSKRMPQDLSSDNSTQTSQALSEFQMATRRLYDPAKKDNQNEKQWIDKINEASTATIQKEMVMLLAEMNYQLYLSRQQQERMILTLSIMSMQGTAAAPTFSSDSEIQVTS
jgi:intracellular multiplication protein IcmX